MPDCIPYLDMLTRPSSLITTVSSELREHTFVPRDRTRRAVPYVVLMFLVCVLVNGVVSANRPAAPGIPCVHRTRPLRGAKGRKSSPLVPETFAKVVIGVAKRRFR